MSRREGRRRDLEIGRSLKRARPHRIPKPRILIICEGAETEPLYFDHFRIERHLRKELLSIIGKECGTHPKTVVEYARKLHREARRDGFDYDIVWCVFDRDSHERIHEAFEQARANCFEVAFSNPSFELWFLLHFQEQGASIERKKAVHKLKQHLPNYDKSEDVYDKLVKRQDEAIRRARQLQRQHLGDEMPPPNPYTNVDALVEYLNQLDHPVGRYGE